ncbi:MAG: hypothetical protein ACLSGS_10950 [Adlercreutzia sp.]
MPSATPSMDICPTTARVLQNAASFEGRAETERGYVLYPRRR